MFKEEKILENTMTLRLFKTFMTCLRISKTVQHFFKSHAVMQIYCAYYLVTHIKKFSLVLKSC